MDHTNRTDIECPGCGGDQFEKHTTGSLLMMHGYISIDSFPKNHFTCVKCNYVIAQPSDISPIPVITVYVVGNSMSKQRQGLVKVLVDTGEDAKDGQREALTLLLAGQGHLINKNKSWTFTDNAWKKAQADPEFNLAEGQYVVDVKDMR